MVYFIFVINNKGAEMQRILILFLSIIILSFSGCNTNKENKDKVIGVSLLTRGHIFYKDLEEAFIREAAKHNYELIITSSEFDLGKQVDQIENFIARKVDAIIVCPADSRGIGTGIRKANSAKIPVFTADIASEEGEIVSHIASDNFAGGKLAGEYMVKLLNGKGKVAIINRPAVTSVLDRVAGFLFVINQYPDVKIVADVNGAGLRDRSLQVTSDVLQANPELDGIFGINDDSALGALDAVQQFNRKNIVIIGYDATPPAVDEIISGGPFKADVIQYPGRIGELTIQAIKDFFDGKEVKPLIPVEVGIVDRAALAYGF
jgi:ribose transport system substrate-binding protein